MAPDRNAFLAVCYFPKIFTFHRDWRKKYDADAHVIKNLRIITERDMDTDKNTDMHGETNMETQMVDVTNRNTDNDINTSMHTDMNTDMDMDSVKHTDKDTAIDAERTSTASGQEHRA